MNDKTGCVNAYLNLSVNPSGNVSPCCMSGYRYKTESGKKTLDKGSILDFWNSKSHDELIDRLNSGEYVKECEFCWQEEKAGKESKRIRDNREFQNIKLEKSMLPVVLDLSMGNLCNIKCRICSPVHSTPWAAEEKKLHSKLNFLLTDDTSTKSFDYNNDYFWKDIIELLPNVKKYDFAGGEPFFIEKHWDIVNAAVEGGWSKHQHIHYNTNGTIFPENYIHLLDEFNVVDIQISSDGLREKFEYMRHPAKWDKVENNLELLIQAKEKSKTNWLLGACISVSAFNVYDIFETFEHYAEKNLRIYINLVHDHRGTRILPLKLKQEIINKLRSRESKFNPVQWHKEREMICRHLENTQFDVHDWKEFWKEIEVRDKFRKESFYKTFTEYTDLIKKLGLIPYVEK